MSVIITKSVSRLEPALRSKAFAFVEKLNEDHALPGLHIEPIQNSVDPRVRTGRVDHGYRAVLFQLTRPENVDYVLHGIWPHDDAIAVAKKVRLAVNPISGVPEIIESTEPSADATIAEPDRATSQADAAEVDALPLLVRYGFGVPELTEELGLEVGFAKRMLTALDDDELLVTAESAPAEWQGLAVLDLANGAAVEIAPDV